MVLLGCTPLDKGIKFMSGVGTATEHIFIRTVRMNVWVWAPNY